MKILCLILSLVLSQIALAYPTAGDIVQFRQADGSVLEMKNTGLDSANHVWLVQVTQGTKVSTEKWAEEDMPSQKEVLSVISKCAEDSGTAENVTVPAGNFQTCKFPNDSGGFTWIGDVPFSMVKVDAGTTKLELIKVSLAPSINQ